MPVINVKGGIDIADGAAGKDLDLACTNGSVNITAGEDVADAVVITASAGGIDVLATGEAGQDIDIVNTGGSINISAEDVADAAVINAATGGIDITADGAAGKDLDLGCT